MRWAYGVTTVPEREKDLLPRTLKSLAVAGFDQPRLFVDGVNPKASNYPVEQVSYGQWDLEMTFRWPRIKTFGNWSLGLWELLVRNPNADRFAMFQDDFVTGKNLREYLTRVPYPKNGYMNLYTFPSNQSLAPESYGWYEARELEHGIAYYGKKQQTGRGAVALVFSKEAVVTLLTHLDFMTKPIEAADAHRKVDGCIVNAMNRAGWREYVHNPSLVQHTGTNSSMGNQPHLQAISFLGEDYDILDLLKC